MLLKILPNDEPDLVSTNTTYSYYFVLKKLITWSGFYCYFNHNNFEIEYQNRIYISHLQHNNQNRASYEYKQNGGSDVDGIERYK